MVWNDERVLQGNQGLLIAPIHPTSLNKSFFFLWPIQHQGLLHAELTNYAEWNTIFTIDERVADFSKGCYEYHTFTDKNSQIAMVKV